MLNRIYENSVFWIFILILCFGLQPDSVLKFCVLDFNLILCFCVLDYNLIPCTNSVF